MSSHDPQADRRHVTSLLKPGVPHRLNLADEAQHRFLLNHLASTGKTPQTLPEFFRALERTRAAHVQNGGPQLATLTGTEPPVSMITGIESQDRINYIASALSAYPDGCYYTYISLQLFDAETGEPIGAKAEQSVYSGGEYVPIQTNGQIQPGKAVRAELVVSYAPPVRETEDEIQTTIESTTINNFPKTPPKSTAPVPKPTHSTPYTLICLRRSAGNDADCDYGPYGTQTVVVPVQGSITYNSAILPLTLDNASAQLYVVSRTTGNNTKYFLPGQPITTNFSISSTDPTKLTWNFDVANFGVPDPFANFSFVDIQLSFAVTTQASPNQIPAWVTSVVDTAPGPSVEKILPLQFADGCIAEGTLITLADGTTRPIEEFEGNEKVLSTNGAVMTVRLTNSGVETDLMIQVKDEQNRLLKITSKHPVLTDNGPKQAHLLQVNDSLITSDGTARIVEISHVAFGGRVWNLTLGVGDGELNNLADDKRAFFANGIMVGDAAMQSIFSQAQKEKTDNILARLPERWHQDFLNSLNQP